MSYILDALKKSEQERGHGNIPDVQTVHSSSLNYRNEKKAYWPYILIIAVVLNLIAIVYFIVNKDNPAETTQQTSVIAHTTTENRPVVKALVTAQSPAAVSDDNSEKKTPEEPSPIAEEKTVEIKKQVADKTETIVATQEKHVVNEPAAIIDFYELPESIKHDLPAIVITAHVYSSNPEQRSIVINNNFMEEGEYVLDGLILYEITPDGAIFNYQGTLFNYGVVSGWQ